MRPHHLTIEAMGPYAEEVAVDFDELAHEGLFLIHGPTGSGKTSLLDALCFALYGEVPGERGERGLRSDHAAPGATPRVALEFTAQGGRYRVVREPFHEAARKRGAGTTTRHPTATLVRLDAGRERTVATKPTEVRDEIRRLVGLTPSQFQQVILLPQGQFEEVLRGRAETREGLLKTLFHTVGYEQLVAWLADEARARRAEVEDDRRHLVVLAEEARRRGADLAGPEVDGATDGEKLFEAERDLGVPDRAGLERLAERATAERAGAETARAAAQAALAEATDTFEQVAAVAERWDRRHRAVVEGERLVAASAGIAAARAALERAELAEQIRPSMVEVARRTGERRHAETRCTRRLAEVGRARGALVRALPAVTALDLEAPPTGAQLAAAGQAVAAELATMEALAGTARREAEHRAGAAAHRREEATAAALATRTEAELVELRSAVPEAAAELAAATTARDRLPGLAEAADRARTRADHAARLAPLRTELADAEVEHRRAKDAALTAWSAHLDLRSRYLDGIAAVLAAALEDDAPCPVCGACQHPRPAEPAAGSVALDAVEAAERAVDQANRAAEGAAAVEARLRLAEAEAAAGAGPQAAADPTAAAAAARRARADHRAAVAVAAGVEVAAERATACTRRIADAEARLAAARSAAEAARASAEVKEHEAGVARALLGEVAGPGSVADAMGLLRDLERALRAAAEQAAAGHQAAQALAQAQERLALDVAASPFTDGDQVEAALLDDAARRALAARVGDHDRRVLGVQDQLGDPLLATLPTERPDVDDARRAVTAAQHANDRAVARHARVHEAQARIAQLVHEHGVALAALLPRELEADRCEAVANRCAGRAAPKVSLQRWVLATYLEAICEHANRRLVTMTAGRYQLRVARDAANAAAKAGLDLWVHDAHTGTLRPVSSLSGGETFQASLALALGVADSVEARTGGVRLDALFVDEGFGSLDPDSLQLAMDELDGLREGGRMVGLISHVGALRERIRVGIEVTPTESGSTVRVGHIAAA